jgi:hypothetical protein
MPNMEARGHWDILVGGKLQLGFHRGMHDQGEAL